MPCVYEGSLEITLTVPLLRIIFRLTVNTDGLIKKQKSSKEMKSATLAIFILVFHVRFLYVFSSLRQLLEFLWFFLHSIHFEEPCIIVKNRTPLCIYNIVQFKWFNKINPGVNSSMQSNLIINHSIQLIQNLSMQHVVNAVLLKVRPELYHSRYNPSAINVN